MCFYLWKQKWWRQVQPNLLRTLLPWVREYNIGINLVKISSFTCASNYGNKSGEDNFNPIC